LQPEREDLVTIEVAVKHPSSWREVVLNKLADHFELFLTTVGVMLAVLVILAQMEKGQQGLLLGGIVWLQGFILWAVRRHSWLRRRALVQQMRVMLQDRVNNQLTVMLGATEVRGREMTDDERLDLDSAVMAAKVVSQELENLSLESVRVWEREYGRSVPRALR
jgi:hypothetical protein